MMLSYAFQTGIAIKIYLCQIVSKNLSIRLSLCLNRSQHLVWIHLQHPVLWPHSRITLRNLDLHLWWLYTSQAVRYSTCLISCYCYVKEKLHTMVMWKPVLLTLPTSICPVHQTTIWQIIYVSIKVVVPDVLTYARSWTWLKKLYYIKGSHCLSLDLSINRTTRFPEIDKFPLKDRKWFNLARLSSTNSRPSSGDWNWEFSCLLWRHSIDEINTIYLSVFCYYQSASVSPQYIPAESLFMF